MGCTRVIGRLGYKASTLLHMSYELNLGWGGPIGDHIHFARDLLRDILQIESRAHTGYGLYSFNAAYMGDYYRAYKRGGTRSFDYGSYIYIYM